MKIFVQFHNGTDITIEDVYETATKSGYFMCLDGDGDKMFATHEGNVLYAEYDYNNE